MSLRRSIRYRKEHPWQLLLDAAFLLFLAMAVIVPILMIAVLNYTVPEVINKVSEVAIGSAKRAIDYIKR